MDRELRARLVLVHEERIDEAEELHHALILPQVLVPLEQKRVLGAVAAFERDLARALLRRDDYHRRRERADAHDGLGRRVRAGHRHLEFARVEQPGRDRAELERVDLGGLLVYLPEDVIVEVPSCVEVRSVTRALAADSPLVRLPQVPTEGLLKSHFAERLRAALDEPVQRREQPQHLVDVARAEVDPRRLLECLLPHLRPEDRRPDQFRRHELGVLHKRVVAEPHAVQHLLCALVLQRIVSLRRYGERVDNPLRVRLAEMREQLSHSASNQVIWVVDPRDDLRCDCEPRVHRHGLHARGDRLVDARLAAVLEPQS